MLITFIWVNIYIFQNISTYIYISATVPLRHEVECPEAYSVQLGQLVPWGPVVIVSLGARTKFTCVPLAYPRVSRFLMIFWHRLCAPFLSILVPTWLELGPKLSPSWPQVGPSWTNLAPSWPILGAKLGSLKPSWRQVGAKLPSSWP